MLLEEIKFVSDQYNRYHDAFLDRVLRDRFAAEQYSYAVEIAEKSGDVDEFIDKFIADKRTHRTRLYAELIRRERPYRHFYTVREMFGNRQFKVMSDVGGVLVGDKNYATVFTNGGNDGTTRVAVFESEDDFNSNLMEYNTIILGEFGIFGYDCADFSREEPVVKLRGRFQVYYWDGFVAFVKCD